MSDELETDAPYTPYTPRQAYALAAGNFDESRAVVLRDGEPLQELPSGGTVYRMPDDSIAWVRDSLRKIEALPF